ncbi:hypothetical protein DEIPH_ctg017orf0141 [Deinococcus phoenicis]|uniref:Uncharacterized protein n=1 Tax=Deinococcus phoenicis TaxID=1476583 RepID=A0A016QRU0_9DEIO|nr:hypothetical protein [Deinococcus phoenicis]EYB68783.1 hypothetical protein DEIPH_ctg017orf0141 [Deinococcus phoenicis]
MRVAPPAFLPLRPGPYQPAIICGRYARRMKRALLLAGLSLGMAGATSPRMTPPPSHSAPAADPSPELARVRPVLDLLVTVRLLADLTARDGLGLDAPARSALTVILREQGTRPTLGPLAAQRTLERLRAVLTGEQQDTLDQARAELERRASLLLARSRFASPDGPVNLNVYRYGFMLPGGAALVRRVAASPELNPYREAGGASAATLQRLLERLAR